MTHILELVLQIIGEGLLIVALILGTVYSLCRLASFFTYHEPKSKRIERMTGPGEF